MNGDDLFALTGKSNMTDEAEEHCIRLMLKLSEIQSEHGPALALEMVQAMIRAAGDWTHLNVGIVAAHQLLATEAQIKWRAMLAGKKREAA